MAEDRVPYTAEQIEEIISRPLTSVDIEAANDDRWTERDYAFADKRALDAKAAQQLS